MSKKRNRLEITAKILELASDPEGLRKSHLVYKANLNFQIINGYLERLLQQELLLQRGKRYVTTTKGGQYLQYVKGFEHYGFSLTSFYP